MKYKLLVSSLLGLAIGTTSSFALDLNNDLITVYVAKKIITMEPSGPEATAVAVRNGKILSVGSLEDLQPWLSKSPYNVDKTFADKIMMPGFIEPHGHPLLGGTALTRPLLSYMPVANPYGKEFPGVKTKEEAFARLKSYLDNTPPSELLLTWGYDTVALGGYLTKNDLDEVSDTRPIIIWDASIHLVFLNTPALKLFNVTEADSKINGVRIGEDGKPNGQFIGVTAASFILSHAMPDLLTPEIAYKNIKFLMDLSHQMGITTTSELTLGIVNFPFEQMLYKKYFNDENNPMRLVAVSDGFSMVKAKGEQAILFVQGLEKESNDKLMYRGVKFFADDAFLSQSMVVENPGYIDGKKGVFITPPELMYSQWAPWWNAGFHIHVHANGNGGNLATLNALQLLMNNKPRFDHRFTIEHYGISTSDMPKKIKALGAVVSVNPIYLYARAEINQPNLGFDRSAKAAALKSLVDAGVPTSMHTDSPVAPPFPLQEVWIAVNRFGLSGKVYAPEERVSLDQALRMITIDAAYTLGEDEKLGSIAPGKFADFTILESDPYLVPKDKLRDIKVWGTVVGGKKFPA